MNTAIWPRVTEAVGQKSGRAGGVALVHPAVIPSLSIRCTNLKTDFVNVKSTHQALIACLASGGTCDSQISAFAAAQQALTVEKYTVWEGLFKGAPNTSKATTLLGQTQQLQQQRHAIFQQAFGSQAGSDTPDAPTSTPVE